MIIVVNVRNLVCNIIFLMHSLVHSIFMVILIICVVVILIMTASMSRVIFVTKKLGPCPP